MPLAGRGRTGKRAEDIACAHLEARGYRIVARNWRRPEGEIDLVAEDARTCVFVEVRSRTGSAYGDPLETISPQKRARIIRAARLFLHESAPGADGFRFDVIGVTFPEDDVAEPVCVHVPDAFRADGV